MQQIERTASRGHVMVVDDDDLFRESVSTNLADAGYSIEAFPGGAEAIDYLCGTPTAELVLLDWKMPGISGIEVMQRLRAEQIDIPIIFLTVLSEQIYEEAGLLGGAVDFVEKSRSFAILQRRIELIMGGDKRRWQTQSIAAGQAHEGLTLRSDSRRALWRDLSVDLTLTEFNIGSYLTENPGWYVSYVET